MNHQKKRRRPVGRLWAIVLAGGEGKRLAPLTRAVYGHDLPKQFAALGSERTFLQETMDRIAPLVPPARTLVVVSELEAPRATEQLVGYPGVQLVLQPTNRGTTAGVLLPLARVLAQDAEAVVTIYPSDHRFRREPVFIEAVRRAVAVARAARGGIALIGAAPESAASDLGWIVPGRVGAPDRAGSRPVRRFVEKPSLDESWELLRQGGLWNTLVIAARGRSLWRAARRLVPEVAGPLARPPGGRGSRPGPRLSDVYLKLPASDLSRDILQVARGLRVVPMIDSGWCDCGTPERLFQSLGSADAERLRRACQRRHRPTDGRRGPRRSAPLA